MAAADCEHTAPPSGKTANEPMAGAAQAPCRLDVKSGPSPQAPSRGVQRAHQESTGAPGQRGLPISGKDPSL
jgi:hypothetical protein